MPQSDQQTLKALVADPQFQSLSPDGKRTALRRIDPDFSKLSDAGVDQFLSQYKSAEKNVNLGQPPSRKELNLPSNMKIEPPLPLKERIAFETGKWLPAVGGALGGLAGLPEGGPVGATATATVGAAGGRAAEQIIDRAVGLPSPKTSGEAAKDIAEQGFAQGAVPELIGAGAGKVLPKLLEGFSIRGGEVAGEPVEAQAIKDMAATKGFRLTPAELSGNRVLRHIQQSGEISIAGKAVAERARSETERSAVNLAHTMLDAFGKMTTPEVAGAQTRNALQLSREAFVKRGNVYFQDEIPKLGDSVMVDMGSVAAEAKKLSQEPSFLVKSAKYGEDVAPTETLPQPTGWQKLVETMSRLDKGPVTFNQALEVKEYLDRFMPGIGQQFADPGSEQTAKYLYGKVMGAMDAAAKKEGGPLAAKWAQARNFWRTGRELYDSTVIRGLIKNNPEELLKSVQLGDVSDINRIKKVLLGHGGIGEEGTPQEGQKAWDAFRRQFVQAKLLQDPNASGNMSLDTLSGLKKRMNEAGKSQLNALFGTDEKGRIFLRNLRTLAETTSRIQPIRTFEWGRYVELGAAGALLLPGVSAKYKADPIVAIEVLPWMISRVLYSPTATRLLMHGLKIPPSTAQVATADITRAAQVAIRIAREEERKKGSTTDLGNPPSRIQPNQ